MKKIKATVPELLMILLGISLFLPGTAKMFYLISFLSIAYFLISRSCKVSKRYLILVVYIVLSGIFSILVSGDFGRIFIMILIFILPYFGVKLQTINSKSLNNHLEYQRRHMITLVIGYFLYVLRILLATNENGFSVTGMMFHSSTLALFGTLIALEIFRDKKKRKFTIIALILLMLPVIGGLRQYVFIFVPISVILMFDKLLRKQSIVASIGLVILLYFTPLSTTVQSLRSDTSNKGSTFSNYLAASINPEEGTINQRTYWWQNAIKDTRENNFLFGHSLTYRFVPVGGEWRSSGMLHSYFVGAFADGGIILFILTVMIFLQNVYKAILKRDKYTLLAVISFIVIFASNGTATTTLKAFLIFYIYGYYEIVVSRSNVSGDNNALQNP